MQQILRDYNLKHIWIFAFILLLRRKIKRCSSNWSISRCSHADELHTPDTRRKHCLQRRESRNLINSVELHMLKIYREKHNAFDLKAPRQIKCAGSGAFSMWSSGVQLFLPEQQPGPVSRLGLSGKTQPRPTTLLQVVNTQPQSTPARCKSQSYMGYADANWQYRKEAFPRDRQWGLGSNSGFNINLSPATGLQTRIVHVL